MKQAIRTAKPRTLASLVFIVFYSTLHGREAAVGDSRPQAKREPAWQSGMIVENSPNPSACTVGRVRLKIPCDGPGRAKIWHGVANAAAAVPLPTLIPYERNLIENFGTNPLNIRDEPRRG